MVREIVEKRELARFTTTVAEEKFTESASTSSNSKSVLNTSRLNKF